MRDFDTFVIFCKPFVWNIVYSSVSLMLGEDDEKNFNHKRT